MNVDANGFTYDMVNAFDTLKDKYMPAKKMPAKQENSNIKPWITKGLKISIKKKNILFQISKQISDQEFTNEYKLYRNLITLLKKKSHDNHYREKLHHCGKNKSKTWQIVNEITKQKRKFDV